MITKRVVVSQVVEVTVDDAKFTPEFFAEFQASMFPYNTIDRHIEHLAQLHARGVVDQGDFIEGYGPSADMGIKLKIESGSTETEIIKDLT